MISAQMQDPFYEILQLIGPFVLPAAIVVFPIAYILGDVITEVYGYRIVRKIIWAGFLGNLVVVMAILAGGLLPPAPFWNDQEAYNRILGFTPRLLAASLLAYLAGEFSNAIIMAWLKVRTGGRFLWVRTISSTIVGEGVDSLVFMSTAFMGIMPWGVLPVAILTQWWAKVFYEVLATPFTYVVSNFLKKREGLDVFDRETRFNPFLLSD